MDKNFIFYENLINGLDFEIDGHKFSSSTCYWDLVVVTSISLNQKLCYEKQLEVKKNTKKFPKNFNYLVINDPDDCKIGSGGSTLNVIKILHDKYNENLYNMKILLIHAGGYSQRMPSCTVLGKIFSSVPCKSEYINDIFDLKMAIYTPFSINMKAGIFITSSDDFETFVLNEQIQSSHLFGTNDNDFILLAHKSQLEIAKDHGVYIFDHESLKNSDLFSFGFYECKTVYQKPSIDKIKRLKMSFNDEKMGEVAFTDSVFFFSHKITSEFLKFYDQYFDIIKEFKIEIDAYRDFLQPLGYQAQTLEEYLTTLNKSNLSEKELELFTNLYNLMQSKKSKILAMTESDFYHLGTINELMNSYLDLSDETAIKFRHALCFQRIKTNKIYENKHLDMKGCVINSFVGSNCKMDQNSIIEFCYFDDNIRLIINENTFLNNCMFKIDDCSNKESQSLNIPSNICMHTIPIKDFQNNRKYVTIFFERNDDLKKKYSILNSLIFLGDRLNETLVNRIKCENQFSIWNLKMFKALDTMSDSFLNACIFIENYIGNKNDYLIDYFEDKSNSLYSLFDLLKYNDFEDMIEFRKNNDLI